MSESPYLIAGPALISFSGGRTSAFMLHQIIQAHGGTLPDDVVVAFANTGKEREETLRFVHECGSRWGVRIWWVEWCDTPEGVGIAGFNSASRNGEPFEALIAKKRALPNWQARWCTAFLKVKPMHALMRDHLGYETFTEAVGLRADEMWRVAKMIGRNADEGRQCAAPLARAGITASDVAMFWTAQPFGLGLRPGEGNCDLCFMKGRGLKKALIRERPGCADWWLTREIERGATFDRRDSIAALVAEVTLQPSLFDAPDDEHDVECGLLCAPSLPGEAA